MRKTKGIPGLLVLKPLSCGTSCEHLDFLLYKKTVRLFKLLPAPLAPVAFPISNSHSTHSPVIPDL